MGEDYKKNMYA